MSSVDPRIQHFIDVEGRADHFYLDTKGIVTVGIGCQVFDPMTIRMSIGIAGAPASHEQIMADFQAVRSMKPGLLLKNYRAVTTCRMSDADILALFEEQWTQTRLELESHLGPITETQMPAQMAIMDMAFNMGVGRLFEQPPHGFPHFIAAFKAQDWDLCAQECKRDGVQQSRNDWTRQQFELL